MAQVLPTTAAYSSPFTRPDPTALLRNPQPRWVSFRRNVKCNGLFSNNRKQENKEKYGKVRLSSIFAVFSQQGSFETQEQAKKAVESALGGKKTEFDKWDEEIKKRAEASGGGEGGGGGWFGWGGGGFNGDHFWQDVQHTSFAILGVIFMYLLFTQGEVMLAIVVNPLLFVMRKLRNGLDNGKSWILQKVASTNHAKLEHMPKEEGHARLSAKERVVRKWRSD
ncbi:hypothetical protein RHMOL_Rhmol02G0166600 [Rhododendron molle]|uniref:Uncharacterized protein n=1 Tax=Rhododendron molle TaxID=49168 RepID=A0ACC0PRA9_RHOML|nr:hypothetical protein RHMOL_Rhmol02G0166600 [Rhododendron molle]